jgi:hypothetical protein
MRRPVLACGLACEGGLRGCLRGYLHWPLSWGRVARARFLVRRRGADAGRH